MKKYYHNTDATKQNWLLGYVSNDGDFLSGQDVEQKKPFALSDVGIYPVIEIIVKKNRLTCGENSQDFCKRLAQLAVKECGL